MGFAPKLNAEHYGAEVSARDVLLGDQSAPASLAVFQETLARYAAGSDETAQVADSRSTR